MQGRRSVRRLAISSIGLFACQAWWLNCDVSPSCAWASPSAWPALACAAVARAQAVLYSVLHVYMPRVHDACRPSPKMHMHYWKTQGGCAGAAILACKFALSANCEADPPLLIRVVDLTGASSHRGIVKDAGGVVRQLLACSHTFSVPRLLCVSANACTTVLVRDAPRRGGVMRGYRRSLRRSTH